MIQLQCFVHKKILRAKILNYIVFIFTLRRVYIEIRFPAFSY